MLSFIDHQFKDRWKFKVSLPAEDNYKLFKAIRNTSYIDTDTVETTYIHGGRTLASIDVTDYSFSEWLKESIRREHPKWWYTVEHISEPITVKPPYTLHYVPESIIKPYIEEDFKMDYKRILSSLYGLPTDASDKEHAEAIVKGDTKMSKVKTQEPTWYPKFRNFKKVIKSGPVTIAWIFDKKVMIRKAKKDKNDPEKAMLMLFAKSQFSSEAAFHRWFRDQMKLFKEAEDNAKN